MIPYNPCGLIVDWGRYRYRTACRFFRDDDTQADIVWYPARDDAQVLGFPSAIEYSEWSRTNYDQPIVEGVGEVYDAPKTISHMNAPFGTGTGHFCGTQEDFENGAVYDGSVDTKYRADGLPLCCPAAKLGGILWGGASKPTPNGGIVWGGQQGNYSPNGQVDCTAALHVAQGHIGDNTSSWLTPATGPTQTEEWFYLDFASFGYNHKTLTWFGAPLDTITIYLQTSSVFPCSTLMQEFTGSARDPFVINYPLPAVSQRRLIKVTAASGITTPAMCNFFTFF